MLIRLKIIIDGMKYSENGSNPPVDWHQWANKYRFGIWIMRHWYGYCRSACWLWCHVSCCADRIIKLTSHIQCLNLDRNWNLLESNKPINQIPPSNSIDASEVVSYSESVDCGVIGWVSNCQWHITSKLSTRRYKTTIEPPKTRHINQPPTSYHRNHCDEH